MPFSKMLGQDVCIDALSVILDLQSEFSLATSDLDLNASRL
jgi:hypothetical protein